MYKLLIEDEEGKTTVVPLALDEITIGRKDGNTIRLTDRNISRFHAKVTISGETAVMEDLDSYNGIKLNGDRISGRFQIREGDLVEVGNYKLRLKPERENQPRPVQPVEPDPSVPAGFIEEVRTRPPTKENKETYDTPVPAAPQSRQDQAQSPEVPPAGAVLVALTGPREGADYPLTKGTVTLGRADDNDIAVDHFSVARNHARVVYDGGVFKVIDLHSADGILVNGEQFARTVLKNGDVIGLGQVKFRFSDGTTVPSAAKAGNLPEASPVSTDTRPPAGEKVEKGEDAAADSDEHVPFGGPRRGGAGIVAAVVVVVALAVAVVVYFSTSQKGQPGTVQPALEQPKPEAEAAPKPVPVQPVEEKKPEAAPAERPSVQQPPPPAPVPAVEKTMPAPVPAKPPQAAPVKTEPKKAIAKPAIPPKVPPTQRSVVPDASVGKEPGYYELYNDGNKMYLQNKVAEAIALFEKSIKANNRFPQAHRSLGIAYAKIGQRDKAAAEYRIYLLLAPNAPDRLQLEKIIMDFEQVKR